MGHSNGDRLKIALLLVGLGGFATGLVLHVAGRPDLAQNVWFAGVAPALALGETLVAAVVAVMYSPAAPSSEASPRAAPAGRCAISSRGSRAWRRDIATTAWSTTAAVGMIFGVQAG